MPRINVLIIEDQEEIRKGYEFLINNSDGFSCIGYPDAETAIARLAVDQPDVVLMDVNLHGMNGIDATRIIRVKQPEVRIMMFTIYENNENVFNALAAGASGYILKQTKPEKLLEAIKDISQGGAPMSSQIARMVVDTFQKKNVVDEKSKLTEREEEILGLLAAGYRNKDLANKFSITMSTVKSHIYNIYQKLHVTSRIDAVNKLKASRK